MYPSHKTAVLSKRLGEEWRTMSNERKSLYTSRAKDIKDTFQSNHPDYVYTRRSSKKRGLNDVDAGPSKKYKGSDNYPASNHNTNTNNDANSISNLAAALGLDPNRPRRPMNSYLIFNREMRHKLLLDNANLTVSEISRAIGQKWATMTPEMKREYTEKAAAIKSNFLKEHPDYVYSRRSKAEIAASGAARRRGAVPLSGASLAKQQQALARNGGLPIGGAGAAAATASAGGAASHGASNSHASTSRANGSGAVGGGLDVAINGKDTKGRGKKRTKDPDAPKHPIPGFLFFRSGERQRIRLMNPNQPIPKVAATMWNDMTPLEREPWLQKAAQDKQRYAEEMQAYSAKKGRMGKGRS
ncbi:MAG: high mobility group box domain-containing protein [Linnemannia gamsii]|nr:MAG: high mobility group box domain-containing protein [Linnemannia gamsii]